MSEKELTQLLEKYAQSACNSEEIRRLESWYQRIGYLEVEGQPEEKQVQRMLQAILTRIDQREKVVPTRTIKRFPQWCWWVAASIVFALGLFETFVIYQAHQGADNIALLQEHDIPAGRQAATLINADGAHLSLDEAHKKGLIEEGGWGSIRYTEDGIVCAMPTTNVATTSTDITYHEVQTANANEFKVTLSDGTTVYLNAGSSLRFPSQFSKSERRIHISGEAYLSVTKREVEGKKIPFVVETDRQEIEVLGTEFNVDAYPGSKKQYVALLHGRVRVKHLKSGEALTLLPGQASESSEGLSLDQRSVEALSAWHRGDFMFEEATLGDILKQIARWYDVEIDCPSEALEMKFTGTIARRQPISAIVFMLNSTKKIKVSLRERRLVVSL